MTRTDRERNAADGRPGLSPLENKLGHQFADISLLEHSLTHTSAAKTHLRSNERLEFLGDRVLGLILAELLFDRFADEKEGALGYRFTALARAETLARVAERIGLSDFIVLSDGERETGGREKPGILANACEAIIAALYLDGGLDAARAFVHENWQDILSEDPVPPKDAKTRLQEHAQARGLALPVYAITGREGPDHAPDFTVEVRLDGAEPASAKGKSKRAAEQEAAAALLARFEEEGDGD